MSEAATNLSRKKANVSIIRYYELERLPKFISLNPSLIHLHGFHVHKVLLLLVTTLRECLHFKAS